MHRSRSIAALLLALLALGCARAEPPRTAAAAAAVPREVRLEIGGMVCAACEAKVHDALAAVPGVDSAEVRLAERDALVRCDSAVTDSMLLVAVRRAGPEYMGFIVAP